jgi:hypothetical protein
MSHDNALLRWDTRLPTTLVGGRVRQRASEDSPSSVTETTSGTPLATQNFTACQKVQQA